MFLLFDLIIVVIPFRFP